MTIPNVKMRISGRNTANYKKLQDGHVVTIEPLWKQGTNSIDDRRNWFVTNFS